MAKELTYESCFPGRFWTAGHLDGKKLMFTIANAYTEDLDGSEDKPSTKPPKLVISFVGTRMELVIPKTNAYCLKEMFGNKLADWVNKRIVLYPTKTKFGSKMVDCIRIYGSPDIAADIDLTVPQGKNKPWNTIVHAMKTKPETNGTVADTKSADARTGTMTSLTTGHVQTQTWANEPDTTILEAWSALGWTREEGLRNMGTFKQGSPDGDYMAVLSATIDEMNAREGMAS